MDKAKKKNNPLLPKMIDSIYKRCGSLFHASFHHKSSVEAQKSQGIPSQTKKNDFFIDIDITSLTATNQTSPNTMILWRALGNRPPVTATLN